MEFPGDNPRAVYLGRGEGTLVVGDIQHEASASAATVIEISKADEDKLIYATFGARVVWIFGV